ncbi:MAG: radical SAM protein [Myxococcota bacterium]|jgi:radical SAM protein with 4Fe4S-binding SPASM domain|nr:radical SAM protein [Myxococcota bacterium]
MPALFRQSRNTFTRFWSDEFGFITNQLAKMAHLYQGRDRVFLQQLSREPQSIEQVLDNLHPLLPDVPAQDLREDFLDFLNCLEQERHVVRGINAEQMEAQEIEFSYKQTFVKPERAIRRRESFEVSESVPKYLYSYVHKHPFALGAHIDVATLCNEDCVHCYYPSEVLKHDGELIETQVALDFLDQLGAHGTLSLTFSGGEPFMHKDFDKMLRRARDNDLIMTIQSNGTLIKDRHIELLKEIQVSVVAISFFSLNPEIHESITRKPGSFRKTLDTINKLVRADVPVSIQCFTTKENKDSIKDMVMWGRARGLRVNTDFMMITQNDFDHVNQEHALNAEEAKDILSDAVACDDFYVNLHDVDIDMEEMAKKPLCGVGVDQINLSANGDLYPCAGFHGYNIGNVKHASLQDIWDNSPSIQKLRQVAWGDFPTCLSCEAFKYCSNCLAKNYNSSGGDLFKRSGHSCDVAFMNKDVVEAEVERRKSLPVIQ